MKDTNGLLFEKRVSLTRRTALKIHPPIANLHCAAPRPCGIKGALTRGTPAAPYLFSGGVGELRVGGDGREAFSVQRVDPLERVGSRPGVQKLAP